MNHNFIFEAGIEHLKNWDAGNVVSPEAVKAFGEDNLFVSIKISDKIFSRICGKSYKAECTIPLEEFRYLKILHFDINQNIRIGEIICGKSIAADLIEIFKELYKVKYPIQRMLLIDDYNADDEASMQANNTSAFNFRRMVSGNKLSKHATGTAIDINPLYNPYVKETDGEIYVAPHNAKPYIDRKQDFPYKIDTSDICYKLFTEHGFEWGGNWKSIKDYQHFEK